VICLQGDLGAGKTTFVQGLAQSWGSLDSVSSPTFVIVNQYRRTDGAQLFHLDTYRLESQPEAEQLDLDSMLAEGALLIEWPERLGNLISKENLWIHFQHIAEEERRIQFVANGERYNTLLDAIHQPAGG
jgi:tRNA threonylcarbamoyladenosine biosynthesis protein TsaE